MLDGLILCVFFWCQKKCLFCIFMYESDHSWICKRIHLSEYCSSFWWFGIRYSGIYWFFWVEHLLHSEFRNILHASLCYSDYLFFLTQFFLGQTRSFGFAGTKDKRAITTQRVINCFSPFFFLAFVSCLFYQPPTPTSIVYSSIFFISHLLQPQLFTLLHLIEVLKDPLPKIY